MAVRGPIGVGGPHWEPAPDDAGGAGETSPSPASSEAPAVRGTAPLARGPVAAAPREGFDAFDRHIEDAIALNQGRADFYSRASGGRSEEVSERLVRLERLALLVTEPLDRTAQVFNERGIPILEADFVSMGGVKAADAPLRYRGRTPDAAADDLKRDVRRFHRRVLWNVVQGDFDEIADYAYELVREIEALEESTGSNLALTRHVVESTGIAALHAERYERMSHGETNSLAKQLLAAQSMGLVGAVKTDLLAQDSHGLGVGILVNDIPPIPFAAEWEVVRARR